MRDILISGAGIAGTALAYWLDRYGFAPTVVEAAPELRTGGFPVDFRGHTHLAALERMGILDEVRARRAPAVRLMILDEAGAPVTELPSEFTGGDLEILHGDLAELLYRQSRKSVRYLFGDSITALTQTETAVEVEFERSRPRAFDLVVGADGIHSAVRRLAFGPEADHLRPLGYYGASFAVPNILGLADTRLYYNTPGKLVIVGAYRDRSDVTFMFRGGPLDIDGSDAAQQRETVARVFADVGWETPRLIRAMWDAPDFYFAPASRVEMERYADGRVVLVGDAGYGAFAGMGTGLAVVGAYVLAGEIARAPRDHRAALAGYQSRMRGYVTKCHTAGSTTARLFVPATWEEIWRRNRAYRLMRESSRLHDVFIGRNRNAAEGFQLPDYPAARGPARRR